MGISKISDVLSHFRDREAKDKKPNYEYQLGDKVRWTLPQIDRDRHVGEVSRIYGINKKTYVVKFRYSGIELPFEFHELEPLKEV